MLLEIGRSLSFFLSLLSLYGVVGSAFFVPGSRWEERLVASLLRVGLAGCICFASGILFRKSTSPELPVSRTLPVRLFFWTLAGVAILFLLSWYLEEYYVPMLWRNQPR